MTNKPRVRGRHQTVVLGFLLQILCISAAAHAQNCPDDISDTLTHEYLLRGASLAELSYKTPGTYHPSVSYRCPQEGAQSYDVFEQPVILRDIEQDLFSHAKSCVEGTYENGRQNGCVRNVDNGRQVTKTALRRRIGARRFEEIHYRCTDSDTALNNLTMTIQWADVQDELPLLIRVGIVGMEAIEYTEDLRLIRLTPGDEEKEEWIGTAGTNPVSSESFLTTVRALQGRSCLFDFALEITASFFRDKCENHTKPANFRGSIVGHSLGGMASEYVALNGGISFAMELCAANDKAIRVLSYNSIGWDSRVNDNLIWNLMWPEIHSIKINGEALEKWFTNMRYLGHLVRYNPSEKDCGPLCRHGINAVQRIIRSCQVCGGMGFSYRTALR